MESTKVTWPPVLLTAAQRWSYHWCGNVTGKHFWKKEKLWKPKVVTGIPTVVGRMTNTLPWFVHTCKKMFFPIPFEYKNETCCSQRNGISKISTIKEQTQLLSSISLSKLNSCWDSSHRIAQSCLYPSSSYWTAHTVRKVKWPELFSTFEEERLKKKAGYLNKLLFCPQSFRNGFGNPEAGKIIFHFSG